MHSPLETIGQAVRTARKGMGLTVSASAKRHLIDVGYSEKFGARPLRRAIEDQLEHEIAAGIIDGTYHKGDILEAKAKSGGIVIDRHTESESGNKTA